LSSVCGLAIIHLTLDCFALISSPWRAILNLPCVRVFFFKTGLALKCHFEMVSPQGLCEQRTVTSSGARCLSPFDMTSSVQMVSPQGLCEQRTVTSSGARCLSPFDMTSSVQPFPQFFGTCFARNLNGKARDFSQSSPRRIEGFEMTSESPTRE
jgi:hypothetical protein